MPKQNKANETIGDLSPEELAEIVRENQRMREQLAAAKKKDELGVLIKTSRWGALQINGLRQSYVGFYRDEWLKIIDLIPQIEAYMEENEEVLTKEESYIQFPPEVRKAK